MSEPSAVDAVRNHLAENLAALDEPPPFDADALFALVEDYLVDEDPGRNLIAAALLHVSGNMARFMGEKRSALVAIDELAARVEALEATAPRPSSCSG